MNIVLVTAPTPTSENIQGPSAMMYHLLKARPQGERLKIFSLNTNHIASEQGKTYAKSINADFTIIKDDLFNFFHKRHVLRELRLALRIDKSYGESNYRLPAKYIDEIEKFKPDLVLLYYGAYTKVARQLSKFNLVVCGYDCFPLHFNRLLNDPFCFTDTKKYKRALQDYKISIFRELEYRSITAKKYYVGIEDTLQHDIINKDSKADFLPHPHFNVIKRDILFNRNKLKVIITGKLDEYTYSDSYELLSALKESCNDINTKVTITFLGKGWEPVIKDLKKTGYTVEHKLWVEDYIQELINYDIQIFPISVGSGTKGKVLDALSAGLLVIGGEVAFENIYIRHKHSCIKYNNIKEVPRILERVYADINSHQKMAENGRDQVLKWHSPQRIFSLLTDKYVNGNNSYNGCDEYQTTVSELEPITTK